MSSRYDEIAEFYGRKHPELLRAVRNALTGSDAHVEDACSHAWLQLLRCPHVVLDVHGFGWLYVVALREAYRLSDRARREQARGSLSQSAIDVATSDLDRRLQHTARVALLVEIPNRRRAMLVLQAAGFTYREIARICDVTLRTVERQLLRGKRSLWRADTDQVAR